MIFLADDEFDAMFENATVICVSFEEDETLDVCFTADDIFGVSFEELQTMNGEQYTGETSVTPSTSVQTLHTEGKCLSNDIVINPIPNNYGLIGYNGALITVT